MNWIIYLSSKYLNVKASERGISAISIIAFLGILFSCSGAIIILSIFNGLHDNFIKKIQTKDAHISILSPQNGISGYESLIKGLEKIKGIKSAYPFFEGQSLLKGNFNTFGSAVMGIPDTLYRSDLSFSNQFKMEEGSFDLRKPYSIVIGYNLAANLGVSVKDKVKLAIYNEEFFALEYEFIVTGIYTAGIKEYDVNLCFIPFSSAQIVWNRPEQSYGIAVKLLHPEDSDWLVKEVRAVIPEQYSVFTWKELHSGELNTYKDQKNLVMVVLFFFFVIVGFNILSTMMGMVLDKKTEIGILKAMGLTPGDTQKVFLINGFFLGITGSSAGVFIGIFFSSLMNDILRLIEITIDFFNRSSYSLTSGLIKIPKPEPFHFFDSAVYYIDKIPIKLELGDLVLVFIASTLLSCLAVIIPASRAGKFRPVEVLRKD